MENFHAILLTTMVFLPVLGAIVLAFIPSGCKEAIRFTTLCCTLLVLALTLWMAYPGHADGQFDISLAQMQNTFALDWIPSFDIQYFMGVDGISFPLVVLTSVVSVLAMGASWSIDKHVKAYCILFLLLETGMLGVFVSLDFFLFYVFWEVMLLPMYFLIGVWGGPRKEYAAIKFFLFTLVGSVLMLIAILMLYFNSDLTDPDLSPRMLAEAHALDGVVKADIADEITELNEQEDLTDEEKKDLATEIKSKLSNLTVAADGDLENYRAALLTKIKSGDQSKHTFNILALQKMGQHTTLFDKEIVGLSLQWWAFILLFIGFAVKVPSIPVHTWLPDAHVEAPTPISMILAGVLLKMGGYGIIRMCYPICPHGGYDLSYVVCAIGVASMVYGAFAALAQTDFKRMVAYSSVSHMGYVVLGLGVWSANSENLFDPSYWNMGVKGAMFQMIAHGISSAGMFFCVGVVYDRVHHRNLNEFGGLFAKMPVYTALAIGLFFAGLGLPGLCGFIGEVFVVLSVWNYSYLLAVISAFVVILTAGYILWAVQRVYLGAEYKGPHEEALVPIKPREFAIGGTLFALALLFGIFPHQTVMKYMDATIDQQTDQLAEWTRVVKQPLLDAEADALMAEEAAEEASQKSVDASEQKDQQSGDAAQDPSPAYRNLAVTTPMQGK